MVSPASCSIETCHLLHQLSQNFDVGIQLSFLENAMELSAVLTPAPEGGYVAYNPETGTTTQGETVEEALSNLREATEVYLEEFPLSVYGRPLLTTFQVHEHA